MNGIADVRQSFGRCLLSGDLFGRFYDIFLASHPDVPARFAKTDFDKQKQLLDHGINLALMYADDKPFGVMGLERIRHSHSKAVLNIDPGLYWHWKQSFIKAISEFDSAFSPALAAQWDMVLQKTIDYVVEGYDGEQV